MAIGPGANAKNQACAATGFFVNEEGYILTNFHVADDARNCLSGAAGAKIMAKFPAAELPAARAVSCDVVGEDRVHDLALLKTERAPDRASDRPLAFARLDLEGVAEGASLAVTGYPGFAWSSVRHDGKAVRAGQARLWDESPETSDVVVLDVALSVGYSGSPVYRAGGGVVAVVVQRDRVQRDYTAAVSIRYAVAMLDRLHVRWHRVAPCAKK